MLSVVLPVPWPLLLLQNDSEIPPNLRASYDEKDQNLLGALGVDTHEEAEEGVKRKKKKKKKVREI